jgi:hypothetical protein
VEITLSTSMSNDVPAPVIQTVPVVVEPLAVMVHVGRRLLQDGADGDHLARDEILADAEMLERTLGLSAPRPVDRDVDGAAAVRFMRTALVKNL